MSAITDLSDNLNTNVRRIVGVVKQKVFGQNNERLDFVMDSFYKLSSQQRNGVIAGAALFIVFFVISTISLYFTRVSALEKDLSDSFMAIQEFKTKKIEDSIEDKKFEKLSDLIKRKTAGVVFKPFFEKLSREDNVEVKNLTEQPVDMDPSDPMTNQIKQVNVEMRLPKISIPRLLKFIIDIEKSEHYMRVQEIKITGLYGNRLFFDTTLLIRGYSGK